METKERNILITGLPGSGKTTLIKSMVDSLRPLHPAGFYTEEIRDGAMRRGFRLIDLAGEVLTLSHHNVKSRYRVGKYGVDVAGFDAYLKSRDFLSGRNRLIIIDEIGKMECLSEEFARIISGILASDKIVLATIALKGSGFIDEIKSRRDIRLIELTFHNRNNLGAEILTYMSSLLSEFDNPSG